MGDETSKEKLLKEYDIIEEKYEELKKEINNNILSLESTEEKLDVEIKNEKTKIEKKLLKIKQQIEIEIDNLRNESENIETINLHESIEKLIQDKNIKEDIIKKYNEKVNELEIYEEKIKHENSILSCKLIV